MNVKFLRLNRSFCLFCEKKEVELLSTHSIMASETNEKAEGKEFTVFKISSEKNEDDCYVKKIYETCAVELSAIDNMEGHQRKQYATLIELAKRDSCPGEMVHYTCNGGQRVILNRLQAQLGRIEGYEEYGILPLFSVFSSHAMDLDCQLVPTKIPSTSGQDVVVYSDKNSLELIKDTAVTATVFGTITTKDKKHVLPYVYGVSIYPSRKDGVAIDMKEMKALMKRKEEFAEKVKANVQKHFEKRKKDELAANSKTS